MKAHLKWGSVAACLLAMNIVHGQVPGAGRIVLPVEVLGSAGTVKELSITLPAVSSSGSYRLAMQIHGLDYENKVSVQLNQTPWISLTNKTVTLPSLEKAYGGIGGGYFTLQPVVALPTGSLQAGVNKIRFRFTTSNGDSNGFRVLSFNLLDSTNRKLIPETMFVQDDPNTWQAPSSSSRDIMEGERLWRQASLTSPGFPNGMKATCSDCHAQDGRDLKYFNYSNYSIRARSEFHGLTSAQGDQIASYIRTLRTPNPGRPWNPPYQPGQGLDSAPVENWSAGAGLKGILERDSDMLPYIFPPAGDPAIPVKAEDNLSARETPLAFQLPDWNHWLPTVHPKDAFAGFDTADVTNYYKLLRSYLRVDDPSYYARAKSTFGAWETRWTEFKIAHKVSDPPGGWTENAANKAYSYALWAMVKSWELNQEFGLEKYGKTAYGATGDTRAWLSSYPFATSPHMMKIPAVGSFQYSRRMYLAFNWYQVQMILNNGNKMGNGTWPIDWGYAYAFIKGMSVMSKPQIGLQSLWLAKALQDSAPGRAPGTQYGWRQHLSLPDQLVDAEWYDMFTDTMSIRPRIMESFLRSWFDKARQYSAAQLISAEPQVLTILVPRSGSTGFTAERLYYMLPQFRYAGVSPQLIDDVTKWAQTIWPTFKWSARSSASCVSSGGGKGVICQ